MGFEVEAGWVSVPLVEEFLFFDSGLVPGAVGEGLECVVAVLVVCGLESMVFVGSVFECFEVVAFASGDVGR